MDKELEQKIVKFGACYDKDIKFQKCAFDLEDCKLDGVFVHSSGMNFGDSMRCSHDLVLPDAGGVTASGGVTMGRCTNPKDGVQCTNRADSCEYPGDYLHVDESCTLQNDLIKNSTTRFPYCIKESSNDLTTITNLMTCVWSRDDCENSELGMFHAATTITDKNSDLDSYDQLQDGCDCSLVHTGGCMDINNDKSTFYCATTLQGCNVDRRFVGVRELLHRYAIDCRLCQGSGNSVLTDGAREAIGPPRLSNMILTPSPAHISPPHINAPPILFRTKPPYFAVEEQRESEEQQESQNMFVTNKNIDNTPLSSGAIAGSIVGSVAAIFLIINVVGYYFIRKKKKNTTLREAHSEGMDISCNGETMEGIEKIGYEES